MEHSASIAMKTWAHYGIWGWPVVGVRRCAFARALDALLQGNVADTAKSELIEIYRLLRRARHGSGESWVLCRPLA